MKETTPPLIGVWIAIRRAVPVRALRFRKFVYAIAILGEKSRVCTEYATAFDIPSALEIVKK